MAIPLISNIEPKNGQRFWLLDTLYAKGGKIEVPTFADLQAIPLANRKHKMWGLTQDSANDVIYQCDASLNWIQISIGGSGTSSTRRETQNAHGFVLGDVIGYDGDLYVKVLASVNDDTDVMGIVTSVIDVNTFEITTAGYINLTGFATYSNNTLQGGVTPNTTYFCSYLTSGRLELNPPTLEGQVQKSVLITLSPTIALVQIGTGYILPAQADGEDDGGITTVQKDNISLPQRGAINFQGIAITATDDPANDRTNISFTSTGHGVHTGDVTSSGPDNLVLTIGTNVVANSKLAVVPSLTLKGNNTGSTGTVQDLSVTQVKSMLAIASGTVNSIPKFNSTSTVGNSNITDNGSAVSISYLAGTGTRMVTVLADGTLAFAAIPSGGGGGTLTTLNGLTSSSQTFGIGSTGTIPNIVSAGTVHTFHIPLASATGVTRGTLSKAEFDVFNGKVGGAGTINSLAKFTATGVIANSSIVDNGSNIIASVADFSVYTTSPIYNISRLVNGSGNGEIYTINYGTSGSGNYWTGLPTASTTSLYSNRALIINSANNIIFSGSGTAEHFRIAQTGIVSVSNLAGTGTRMVVVSPTGILSTQVIPSGGSGGISSLGGLTGATQIFGAGTTGLTHSISSSGTTHTLNIPNANTTSVTSGTISKVQFDTFNTKIGGSGTLNSLPKFTGTGSIGNSTISETSGILRVPNLASSSGQLLLTNASGDLVKSNIISHIGGTAYIRDSIVEIRNTISQPFGQDFNTRIDLIQNVGGTTTHGMALTTTGYIYVNYSNFPTAAPVSVLSGSTTLRGFWRDSNGFVRLTI